MLRKNARGNDHLLIREGPGLDPDPGPEPQPDPDPDPYPDPDPDAEPEPSPSPDPKSELEPEPEPILSPIPIPAPIAILTSTPVKESEVCSERYNEVEPMNPSMLTRLSIPLSFIINPIEFRVHSAFTNPSPSVALHIPIPFPFPFPWPFPSPFQSSIPSFYPCPFTEMLVPE